MAFVESALYLRYLERRSTLASCKEASIEGRAILPSLNYPINLPELFERHISGALLHSWEEGCISHEQVAGEIYTRSGNGFPLTTQNASNSSPLQKTYWYRKDKKRATSRNQLNNFPSLHIEISL